jgi:hypothetical protein
VSQVYFVFVFVFVFLALRALLHTIDTTGNYAAHMRARGVRESALREDGDDKRLAQQRDHYHLAEKHIAMRHFRTQQFRRLQALESKGLDECHTR